MTGFARLAAAVFFDFNGTLAHDEHIVFAALRSIHAEYFDHTLTESEYSGQLIGRSDDELLQDGLDRYPHRPDVTLDLLRSVLLNRYRADTHSTQVISDDAVHVVRALADAGVKLGVVTGAQRAQVVPVLDRAGLSAFFDVVIALDDVKEGKPSPEGYLLALHRIDVPPGAAVFAVEDTVVGLQAARAARLCTVAVTGSQPRAELAANADHVISGLDRALLALEPLHAILASNAGGG